jgi:hypothetical protein
MSTPPNAVPSAFASPGMTMWVTWTRDSETGFGEVIPLS